MHILMGYITLICSIVLHCNAVDMQDFRQTERFENHLSFTTYRSAIRHPLVLA
jgi:hypothetical protein